MKHPVSADFVYRPAGSFLLFLDVVDDLDITMEFMEIPPTCPAMLVRNVLKKSS
jgi:hypothetical protein